MGRIIEGYWSCKYCGTEDIKGSVMKCPGCGRTRGPEVKFYMKETTSAEDQTKKEADWLCSYCDSLNPAQAKFCPNCGATKEDSEKNYYMLHPERQQAVMSLDAARKKEDEPEKPAPVQEPKKKRNLLPLFAGILVAILALVIISLPKKASAEISRMSWERVIEMEHQVTVKESGWDIPDGARVYDEQQEIQSYNTVLDHYEEVERTREVPDGSHEEVVGYKDLGNGNFEEITETVTDYREETYTEQEPVYVQVPVMGTKYYYEIERWQWERDVVTNGDERSTPYWGDAVTRGPDERQGSESEEYYIYIQVKDKEYKCQVPYSVYSTLQVGDQVDAQLKGDSFVLKQ